jgi:signal transduction histidine kinase/CheY-like chemotaxis protein
LCEHTIAALSPPGGGPACFEVLDLSKDSRFNELDFIAGPPHFRYYAGVPLRTSRGINIGSIYILDSKVRPALSPSEKSFLGIMADNVIQHLEMSRDKKDRRRTFRMNQCLSAYVDPALDNAKRIRRHSNHSESTEEDTEAAPMRSADGCDRIEVITRAAELLRESMDIEEGGGGVLYLDTSLATVTSHHPSEDAATGIRNRQKISVPSQQKGHSDYTQSTGTVPSSPTTRKPTGSTEILVHTYQPSSSASADEPEFIPFSPEELLKLIRKYPRGRLFTYDQEGQELSDSTDSESLLSGRPRSRRRQQRSTADSVNLHMHFPGARQVVFMPIWDSTTSRPGACFVYNSSEYRNFSRQLEFLHCITFNNCVDTELLRLSNLKAAEQKTDFIGSISHELRSPLHGILASCEFLQDTPCSTFQKSLVNTAESCARTLLDTVNMVLDYSKINAFERDKVAYPTLSLDDVHSKRTKAVQTKLSAHRAVDLAVLTEEVIEGVATGHAFDGPQYRAARHESWDCNNSGTLPEEVTILIPRRPDVELIVDISDQDWTCWCEPGSIRRIVMNLVGNALKYTNAGFVHVKLETQISKPDGIEYGILTVADSGQGISPAYLKNNLYNPFSQESNQAPGVGLGLSLVKSIVSKIYGQIHIESTVDVGTKATVKFPITRTPSDSLPQDSASHSKPNLDLNGDEVSRMTTDTQKRSKSIALYQHEEKEATNDQQEAFRLLRKSLTEYLSSWSGNPVVQWEDGCTSDIVVVEESALEALLKLSPGLSAQECQTNILVLRGTASKNIATSRNMEDVRHPIGPHKLARALQACLDRSQTNSGENTGNSTSSSQLDAVTTATASLNISVESASEDPGLESSRSVPAPVAVPFKSPTATTAAISLNGSSRYQAVVDSNNTTPTHSVLIVDDNTINLRLLQVGMKKRGYTSISSASDGLQAVNTYRTLLQSSPPAPPGIILMDLSMPIMNGFEATRQIREIEAEHNSRLAPSQAPLHSLIIALTGLASVRDQKEAYTAGVDSYIMKPVSFAKLTTLLEKWTIDGKFAGLENGYHGTAIAA